MIHCASCGAENPDGQLFCADCHHEINAGGASQSPPPAPEGADLPVVQASAGAPVEAGETPQAAPEAPGVPAGTEPADAGHAPRKCPACRMINPPSAELCDCGYNFRIGAITRIPKPLAPVGTVSAGSLGSRLAAYVADLVVVYFIVFLSVLLVASFHPFEISDPLDRLVSLLVLMIYMTVAQATCHTTIGKYIFELEVRSSLPRESYPTLGRIITRETIGRVVSSWLLGIGYWTSARYPLYQAWSDKWADTVVCRRSTKPVLRTAFISFAVIALVSELGVLSWTQYTEDRLKRWEAFSKEFSIGTADVNEAREAANKALEKKAENLDQYQDNMREVLAQLDRYDACSRRLQASCSKSLAENRFPNEGARREIERFVEIMKLRDAESAINRREARMVVDYDPKTGGWDAVVAKLRVLDSDLEGLEYKIKQLSDKDGAEGQ
jgi:hypothetical protein